MNFFILLFFGILNTVNGIYKIPEHDACVLKVLLCDDFTKPLTPVDNSTVEMFKTIGELNAVCDELSKFRICLKNAEKFCEEHSDLDIGFALLKNRRLAFDLCVRGSPHQHVYMMEEGCVNKYSHSAIEFCTDKAVEKVGLEFDLGDYESECRFLGEIQHCHIEVVTDQCGSIAGNLLERLVVFRGERDFMCIEYENEKLKNLEAFHATMDSYVQQYKNIVYQIEKEDVTERIDRVKDFKIMPEDHVHDRTSSEFQSRNSPTSVENCASNKENKSYREHPFNPESTEKITSCSCLSGQKFLDLRIPQGTAPRLRRFCEQLNGNVPSDEKYACKTKASFLVTEIRPNGELYHLGFGEADILWSTYSPLKDVSCAWIENPTALTVLTKCSIMIDHSILVEEMCKLHVECEFSFETKLATYEIVNEREAKRVAELRVHKFLKYSPTYERIFSTMIDFFINYADDFRYWCSEQHAEQDPIQSTSRKGLVPSQVEMYDITKGQSNFHSPEHSECHIDTEIHLLSSRDKDLESELKVKNFSPQNYEENLNSFLTDEIFNENNSNEPFSLHPSALSKSSSHLYRPYELFRPRVGEMLGTSDQDAESRTNLDVLSFEDSFQNNRAEEMCPVLPENVSELINELAKENYMNWAHSLHIINSNHHKSFQISENRKDLHALSNINWKIEDPENINTNDQQNKFEKIYVVTTSADIKTAIEPGKIVDEYADAQNLDDSRISNTKDDNQDYAEVSQEREVKSLPFEKESVVQSTNAGSLKGDFLELISDYQNKYSFSNKFAETSTNHEAASEEEFSPKSKKFSRRWNQKYPKEAEERLLSAFEVLAKIKIKASRKHKISKENRMKNRKNKNLRKDEL